MLLEYIHSKNYIHRDIKPENFLVECEGTCSEIFAVDFGLAKKYRFPPRCQHIPYTVGKPPIGTPRYASVHAHMGCEQSRRDDLESVMYMALYLIRGDLPWKGLKVQGKQAMNRRILELKQTSSAEALCEGLPGEVASLLNYVRTLKFDENPDYRKIQNLLEEAGNKVGVKLDKNYDWVRKMKKRVKNVEIKAQSQTEKTESDPKQEEIKHSETFHEAEESKEKIEVNEKAKAHSMFIKTSNGLKSPTKKNDKKTDNKKEKEKKVAAKKDKKKPGVKASSKKGGCNII